MFSNDAGFPEQGATSRGPGAGRGPWTVQTRLALALCSLIAGLALRVATYCAGCESPTMSRVVPVLLVDPNTAPASVLEALPHVGPSLARRLIEQRAIRPFESIEELRLRVRGLGPATMARLAPHLRIKSERQGRQRRSRLGVPIAAAQKPTLCRPVCWTGTAALLSLK